MEVLLPVKAKYISQTDSSLLNFPIQNRKKQKSFCRYANLPSFLILINVPCRTENILKDELMNLREENEGINIILKQANKRVKKDKFSALEYGLYYIRQKELSKKKKKKFNAKEWRFYN